MAYPTLDTNHVAEATALLTDHYRTKVVIPKLLQCYMNRLQELEGVFWDIINKMLLANSPVGDQLNKLGNIVGAVREPGMSDADYLQAVKIQIRVNRSQGLSEDVIQVATLALNGASIPLYVDVSASGPITISWVDPASFIFVRPPKYTINQGAAFSLDCSNLQAPNNIARLLGDTRSVGTYGELHYTTWADGNDFEFGSVYSSAAGQGTFGSVYTTSVGGLLAAGAVC